MSNWDSSIIPLAGAPVEAASISDEGSRIDPGQHLVPCSIHKRQHRCPMAVSASISVNGGDSII